MDPGAVAGIGPTGREPNDLGKMIGFPAIASPAPDKTAAVTKRLFPASTGEPDFFLLSRVYSMADSGHRSMQSKHPTQRERSI